MRPVNVWLNSATFSPWVPIDYYESGFGIGLGFNVSSGATLTASVQHTFDDTVVEQRPAVATQSGTTITVVDYGSNKALGNHGLSVGDWVSLQGSQVGVDNFYPVASVVSATSYTLTSTITQTVTLGAGLKVSTANVYNHATLAGISTRQDGNYAFPPMAVRLIITSYTSGVASLSIRQGQGGR